MLPRYYNQSLNIRRSGPLNLICLYFVRTPELHISTRRMSATLYVCSHAASTIGAMSKTVSKNPNSVMKKHSFQELQFSSS